jgi:selenocysteine-specific elongation factor
MLAGAAGIDLVILVVAADEGVMPQTREHLDILRFLSVTQGIVVLNKIDLVNDADWLTLVKDDLRRFLSESFLEDAPILEVSAKTGQGINHLVDTLDRLLDQLTARDAQGPIRLPIDRAFIMKGFGTVVTGTLWSGRIRPGDVVELLPQSRSIRVRAVQVHGQEVPEALAGSRVALNLVGIDKDEIRRGDVLGTTGIFQATSLIDVRVQLLQTAPTLSHRARIRLYLGADEAIGRLLFLDRARLNPRESAFVQIDLEKPIVAAPKDRIVLRRYSPMTTVGGGEVISAHPPRRRRGAASVVDLERASHADVDERVEMAIRSAGRTGAIPEEITRQVGTVKAQVDEVLGRLITAGRVVQVHGRLFHATVEQEVAAAAAATLDAYHARSPWRIGMPKDELKATVFVAGDDRLYAHVLEELVRTRKVEVLDSFVRRSGYAARREPVEVEVREQILTALRTGRYAPPTREDLATRVADQHLFERMFQVLLDEGIVIEVASGIFFPSDILEDMKRAVIAEVGANGSITVARLRDQLGTSRKFALTVLEYFDRIKLTRRVGDVRVLLEEVLRIRRT